MGTRAAAFTVKIRSLYDYQLRLMHNVMPPPSGVDIANTIKYFSQTLLTVLKDVPSSPLEMIKNPEMDSMRLSLFPNLDYKGLYNSIVPFIEVAPLIQYGLYEFGQAVLQCLGCLLPFLDRDMIDNLPFLTSSCIAVFPVTLHQEIVNSLCFYILPFTIPRYTDQDQDNCVCQSLSAVIMMMFQYSKEPAHHCQLLECLMGLRSAVLRDLLCVIAHGSTEARSHAAKLLFYYWPPFNANLFDKKGLLSKFASNSTPFVCQRDLCPNTGNAEAAKVCYDHCISITFASDSPPPLYLCIECANEIHREHPNQRFFDILHMMQQVSMVCENKNCRSNDKAAYSICFSTECASYNGNHPIRFCQQCHNNRHNNRRGSDHIVHKSLPPMWSMDVEMQNYMVEAIISLLREAQLPSELCNAYNPYDVSSSLDNFTNEDRQLLGRYGVWLLVGRCSPDTDTSPHILGRLLSMLFHWFHATSFSTDSKVENMLEKLKQEHVYNWLQDVLKNHYDLFTSCLLAHPSEYVRIGGHWDTLASRTSHLKDGFLRLVSLIPYKIITPEIWDYIMPYWMEAIVSDVPEKELPELQEVLMKIFDVDNSPLKFDAQRLYHFVLVRFEKTTSKVQEQTLHWLQIVTMLEITLPLNLLFDMFRNGVRTMKNGSKTELSEDSVTKPIINGHRNSISQDDDSGDTSCSGEDPPTSRNMDFDADAEHNLSCCILMLDILLNQMELQEVDKHGGINTSLCRDVCCLLKCMVAVVWIESHSCTLSTKSTECRYCDASVMWHQLSLQLIKYLSPTQTAHPPDVYIEEVLDDVNSHKSPPEADKKDGKSDAVMSMPIPESVGGVLVHMPHVCSIMTATVETVSEQLDLAAIIPTEKVVSAVARAITLSETDVATATVQIVKPQVIDDNEQNMDDEIDDYWHTSVGKFRFVIDELPQHLQYIYQLLQELPKTMNPDTLYYMLQCLNILCLNGDAFTKASKYHYGFFVWCQENLLIKNLWEICDSEHSHICEVCVPLLLHCVTLPCGSDVFWSVIQDDFHNSNWKIRFVAVERVTVIARFMDSTPLRNVLPLQAALANAFCYLISSIDDSNVYIAQRSALYLGTIHDRAIKSLILCLETQFDSVIIDRPMVLQSLYQLHNTLCDRKILTWEFFLNRFDTLFLEAQINLEKMGDISYLRDLRNADLSSDTFVKKVHRAQEALSQTDVSVTSSMKTLSASFGTKWPYKRTMSVPAFVPKQDTKQDGHIHSLNMADEGNLVGFLNRIIDLEEADQETIHLLVFLLMQFLSRTDQAFPAEEKPSGKAQHIVLRHLYLLLGFNQAERIFMVPPQRLRTSPVFNVFLSNLPQLLDQNHLMGWQLLPTVMTLLQYSPWPFQPTIFEQHQVSKLLSGPTYSLWFLEPHLRHSWLMSLLIILYKYQYNQQPNCKQLSSLIKIILKTLDSQNHQCRRIPAAVVMPGLMYRSRDVSLPSLGQDEHTDLQDTPPMSPTSSSIKTNKNSVMGIMSEGNWDKIAFSNKSIINRIGSGSVESQEITENEQLVAIPENDGKKCEMQTLNEVDEHKNDVDSKELVPKSDGNNSHKTDNDPLWFIGCEEECFLTAHPLKKCIMPFTLQMNKPEIMEKPSRLNHNSKKAKKISSMTTTGIATTAFAMTKTITTDTHKHIGMSIVKNASAFIDCNKQSEAKLPVSPTPSVNDAKSALKSTENIHLNRIVPIPAPSIERLLPIGEVKISSQKPQQKFTKIDSEYQGSPESPLSKMNVMTVESSDDVDSSENTATPMSSSTASQLEIPTQERLLHTGSYKNASRPDNITELVEKVREALGVINEVHSTGSSKSKDSEKNDLENDRISSCEIPVCDSNSRSASPRRLIKQVALDSPPPVAIHHSDLSRMIDKKGKNECSSHGRHRHHKSHFLIDSSTMLDRQLDSNRQMVYHAVPDLKHTAYRIGEHCIMERCTECGLLKEEYSDEELGLCIIILGTFIHREPSLAAPLLPDILNIVANVALTSMYPWQNETNVHLPGGAVSVAHQFLRCVLHQLAPNGVFVQMFQTKANEKTKVNFFRSVSQALLDFNELNPIVPLQLLLESLNSKKILPMENLPTILDNMACYLECLPLDVGLSNMSPIWGTLLTQAEVYFRRIIFVLPNLNNMSSLLSIMVSLLKMPNITQFKGILDPFSKVLSSVIQSQPLEYHHLVDLCYLCNRNFSRERDRMILARTVVYEFVQALKFKVNIPESNLLLIINLILQDVGGSFPFSSILENDMQVHNDLGPVYNTNISDCMRHHLGDILEFLTDFHTLTKLKTFCKHHNIPLNEDTLGGALKSGVAQYLSLEITRCNNRDNRAVSRYLPWLYNPPSAIQQGQRDFIEWVGHIRLLSWLLLGSLTHTALYGGPGSHHATNSVISQPIPQEASCHIADHIQMIMGGFAEQSKLSVLHMSSLFHAFILCQLWTIYLEQNLCNNLPTSEAYNVTMGILFDFWGKVTPCILQLVSSSKVLAEKVNLHFLTMLEALLECQSTVLSKLLPLWGPVLYSHHVQLPGNLQMRLQNCKNFCPTLNTHMFPTKQKQHAHNTVLLQWLQRLQFKMGQIELQSSTATQFYSL